MTQRPFEDLVTLARSWARAPDARIVDGDFESAGFDRSERVYRIVRSGPGREVTVEFDANESSPLFNVPLLVERWGTGPVSLLVDGRRVAHGPDFRYDYIHTLDDSDLIVWLAHQATTNTTVRISATTTEE